MKWPSILWKNGRKLPNIRWLWKTHFSSLHFFLLLLCCNNIYILKLLRLDFNDVLCFSIFCLRVSSICEDKQITLVWTFYLILFISFFSLENAWNSIFFVAFLVFICGTFINILFIFLLKNHLSALIFWIFRFSTCCS